METIFTKIIKGEIPSYKVAENDKFYSFLDISPLAKGHTLVVPKIQNDYIFDLDDATLAEMVVFAKKVALAIEKAVPCQYADNIKYISILSEEEFKQTAASIAAEFKN